MEAALPPRAGGPGSASGPVRGRLIELAGLGKVFANGTEALAGVDLTIGRGEFLALLGPSGCGKSTILRLIAGLDRPTSGTIRWWECAAAQPDEGQTVGFVFQEPTLMPWASVFDNVWLPLRLKGVGGRAAREQVMDALAQVELTEFERSYPRELSGGMKMRVSIARALATNPAVLLMDEPFAALDEITRFRLNDDLLRLWERLGWTVVFVTHSVFESVYLSERIAVMSRRPGRVVSEIVVDEPMPRTEAFRTSPHYGALCRETSRTLEAAMAAGEPGRPR